MSGGCALPGAASAEGPDICIDRSGAAARSRAASRHLRVHVIAIRAAVEQGRARSFTNSRRFGSKPSLARTALGAHGLSELGKASAVLDSCFGASSVVSLHSPRCNHGPGTHTISRHRFRSEIVCVPRLGTSLVTSSSSSLIALSPPMLSPLSPSARCPAERTQRTLAAYSTPARRQSRGSARASGVRKRCL